MVKLNDNFRKFEGRPYLFAGVARKAKEFNKAHPGVLIRLGIGDATEPIDPLITGYLAEAAMRLGHLNGYSEEEMKDSEMKKVLHEAGYDKFNGYGDEQGNEALKRKINEIKYGGRFSLDEIFISDGAKCDTANIQQIFSQDAIVALQNPAYPVYEGSNVIAGRTGRANPVTGEFEGLVYMPCTPANDFQPAVPNRKVDLVYLCSPNNPTGTTIWRSTAQSHVDNANAQKAIIVSDCAYERYIKEKGGINFHSIYEIPGAEKCAIETGSFSKEAGFTGMRLGWCVVPKTLQTEDGDDKFNPNWIWNKRQTTEFNGASNLIQAAGLAVMSPEGQKVTQELVNYYMENAKLERQAMESLGFQVYGGRNAPYVWVKLPEGRKSAEFADAFLNDAPNIVCTPGSGFGSEGEGYIRLSAYGHRENILRATERISKLRM
jgi:LL-diaminopimelate aminotransferase